jgi:nucleoside diphosphate kinase
VSVLRISRDDVSELYKGVFEKRGKDFFEQTLDYVSGGLSILILVSGENTLSKLKEIKGKTWQSGLRLKYAQNFVHNTFHTPDTKEDLQREMEVLLKKF